MPSGRTGRHRRSTRAAALTVALAAASCGSLVGPGHLGPPLAEFDVRWLVAGEEPRALALAIVWFGATASTPALARTVDPARPSVVRARVDEVPPAEALVTLESLALATGVLVAFEDGDGDGRLSFTTPPVDFVVGNAAFLRETPASARLLVVASGPPAALEQRGLRQGLNVTLPAGERTDGGTLTLAVDGCLDQQWFGRPEVVARRERLDEGPPRLDGGCP